jgi:hypothetical protein
MNSNAQNQKDSISIVEIKVSPWKTLTYGAFSKHLGLTTNDPGCDFIEGFDFEWGYYYTLEVEKTKLAQPPMDGSSLEYKLVSIQSKNPATSDMVFQMRLEFDKYLGKGDNIKLLVKKSDTIYLYDDEIEIHIPEDMKAAWDNFLSAGKDANALFTFQVENGILFRGIRK